MKDFDIKFLIPKARFSNQIRVPFFQEKKRSDQDYFHIASLVYNNVKPKTFYESVQSWSVVTIDDKETGYFGASFLDLRVRPEYDISKGFRVNRSKIIFAHRGTNELKDLLDDFKISKQKIPSQFQSACDLVEKTYNYIGSINFESTHVGHSLGAALSLMCGYKYGQKAIGFETPGIDGILYDMDSKGRPYKDQFFSYNMSGSYISDTLPGSGNILNCEKNMENRTINPTEKEINSILKFLVDVLIDARGGAISASFKEYIKNKIDTPEKGSLKEIVDNIIALHSMENMKPCFDSTGRFITNPKELR